jgi:large subunit ribosomal protein L9
MKIILRQQVENLGLPGDVVKVKDGYAINYLIPQQLALPYTDGNRKRVEMDKRRLAAREAKIKAEAEILAKEYTGIHLHFFKKAGEEGVLYGSVTPTEIADALEKKGLKTDKRKLILHEPIKKIGDFGVGLRLHPEIEIEVMISVHSEDEEAAPPVAAAELPPVEQTEAEGPEADTQDPEQAPPEQ